MKRIGKNKCVPLPTNEGNVERQAFIKAVVKGMADLEEGRELSLADVKKHLKIRQLP